MAKQAATIHHLSGGRLVLGAAIGSRDDDYTGSGLSTKGRGRRLEEMLEEMKRVWAGEKRGTAGGVGPELDAPPPIVIGGRVDAAFRRAARYDGWMMGGGAPERFAEGRERVEAAWKEAGRDGEPRKAALAYFALGDDARKQADWYLRDYYAFLGEAADQIAASAATDEDTVKRYVSAFADAGCDELIMFPSSPDPEQVDLLASAAL